MKLIFNKKIGVFLMMTLVLTILCFFNFYKNLRNTASIEFSELVIRTKDTSEIKKIIVKVNQLKFMTSAPFLTA